MAKGTMRAVGVARYPDDPPLRATDLGWPECAGPDLYLDTLCDNGHAQGIRLIGFARDQAEYLADLLDGTRQVLDDGLPQRLLSAGCRVCRAALRREVREWADPPAPVSDLMRPAV